MPFGRLVCSALSIRRCRGAGENPAAAQGPRLVDAVTHEVPDGGNALPLVNDMRLLPQKHERGVVLGRWQLLVDIADGSAVLTRCPCLATPFRAFDFDGAKNSQVVLNLLVDNTWKVSFWFNGVVTHCDSYQEFY